VSDVPEPTADGEGPGSTGDPIPRSAGLCARCVHARAIATRRGSMFILCEASQTDPRLDRYPRLPVVRCHGFDPLWPGEPAEPAAT
jgi:hypothetical protein